MLLPIPEQDQDALGDSSTTDTELSDDSQRSLLLEGKSDRRHDHDDDDDEAATAAARMTSLEIEPPAAKQPGLFEAPPTPPLRTRPPRTLPYLLLLTLGACYIGLRPFFLRATAGKRSLATAPPPPPLPPLTPAPPPLVLQAQTDGYAPLSQDTLQLYGWDVILEANRPTTLRVLPTAPSSTATATSYDWYVTQNDGAVLLAAQHARPEIHNVRCTRPGMGVALRVTEHPTGRTYTTATAVCKEVRRELRALRPADRHAYLASLDTFYRTSLGDGRRRFGPRFANNAFLTAAHNTHKWCLHDPNQFLAVHSAFVYWGEQNQKRVDPRSPASPYWDFHIDAHTYGADWWYHHPWFQADNDEGFGPMNTSAAAGHVVAGAGRFAYLPVARALDGGVYDEFDPGVDSYGFISGNSFTLNGNGYVTRSLTVCGLEMALPFAPAQNLFDCYDRSNTWKAATQCMYMQVHLQLHSHFGGGSWNCAYDLGHVHRDFPQFSAELLSFLGVAGRMTWSAEKTAHTTGLVSYRECDLNAHRCRCPGLDAEGMPYDDLYRLLATPLRRASRAWPGQYFLAMPEGTERLQFKGNDGRFLPPPDQDRLLRLVARLWCEAAVDGHFVTMASINDPMFYASHVYFDRLAHFLALSPALTQRGFDRTWPPVEGAEEKQDDDEEGFEHFHHHVKRHECLGAAYTDSSPFMPFYLSPAHLDRAKEEEEDYDAKDEEGEGQYSMREVDALLHPLHPDLPYVYDDLVHWGGKVWAPRTTV